MQKRLEETVAAQDTQLSADISQAEAAHQSAKVKIQSSHEQRKTRITAAQKSSKRQALERIENEEGRVKYASQKGVLDTERNRHQSLRQNDATLAEFNQQLAENHEGFVALETR